MLHNFKKFDLDLCIGTCPAKFKIGQGHLAISFLFLMQSETFFASACFKISTKNNLK